MILKKRQNDVVESMFLSSVIAMIFTHLVGVIANNIDGIITAKYLGAAAYSSVSLLGPLINTIALFSFFVAIGGQIVCSELVGKGKQKEANEAFSFVVALGIVISVIFVILCLAIPNVICQICGISKESHPEIYLHMMQYLKGYAVGIPFLLMIRVLGPIAVVDNQKKLVTISSVVLCTADVIGDFLNVFCFKGGMRGMGLATSVAYAIQALMLIVYFLSKKSYFKFNLQSVSTGIMKDVITAGSPLLLREIVTVLRDLFINRFNLFLALTAAAITARSLQNDLNMILFSIGMGIGQTLVSMASLYYGANDLQGLKRLYIYAAKVSVVMSGAAGMIVFVFARAIVNFYNCEPETCELAIFALRCMAVGLVFDTLSMALQNYLQAIRNLKLVNFMTFAERFFVPVFTALVLGWAFGSKGIMASMALGKVVLILIMFIVVCVFSKGLPKRIEDYMFLPKEYGGKEEDNFYCKIVTIEDAVNASAELHEFCLERQISSKRAYLISLFVEEMATNTIKYGKKGKKDVSIDMRAVIVADEIILTLRDYGQAFDPKKYYDIHKDEDKTANIGIRIVMETAKDVQYMSAFNSNNLMIIS